MTEFERINAPRIDKLRAALATICKSAASNKATGDLAGILAPFLDDLRRHGLAVNRVEDRAPTMADVDRTVAAAPIEPAPRRTILETPHIMRIGEFVAGLPKTHLSPMATHLINRLCEEAETGGKTHE